MLVSTLLGGVGVNFLVLFNNIILPFSSWQLELARIVSGKLITIALFTVSWLIVDVMTVSYYFEKKQ